MLFIHEYQSKHQTEQNNAINNNKYLEAHNQRLSQKLTVLDM